MKEGEKPKYGFAILFDAELSGFQIYPEVTVAGETYKCDMSVVPAVLRTLVEAQTRTDVAQKVIELMLQKTIPVGPNKLVSLVQFIAGQTVGLLEETHIRRNIVGQGGKIIQP